MARSPPRGKHGVGRIDIVENRFIGMKSRGECASAPGAPSVPVPSSHPQAASVTLGKSATPPPPPRLSFPSARWG